MSINRTQASSLSLEKAVLAFAGFMVLMSLGLSYFVHPNFVCLTVFVGVNLLQSAFTGFCLAAILMRKFLGLKSEKELAGSAKA